MNKKKIDLVILAGGKGSRIKEYLHGFPKPMLKFNNKYFLNEKNYFFLLFCFTLLVSFFYFYAIDQRAINVALIISNEINYKGQFSILNINYHNSWNLKLKNQF